MKRTRHFEPPVRHIYTPPKTVSQRQLLLDRKAGLELGIRAAKKAAKTAGTVADVRVMNDTLRSVKEKLAKLGPVS